MNHQVNQGLRFVEANQPKRTAMGFNNSWGVLLVSRKPTKWGKGHPPNRKKDTQTHIPFNKYHFHGQTCAKTRGVDGSCCANGLGCEGSADPFWGCEIQEPRDKRSPCWVALNPMRCFDIIEPRKTRGLAATQPSDSIAL